MSWCMFVSDLHGDPGRYHALAEKIASERPVAVLLGGDLFPHGEAARVDPEFCRVVLRPIFESLRTSLAAAFPRILLIPGNDDGRSSEPELREGERRGLWEDLHDRTVLVGTATVTGYAFVPPTPFALKDWERYDVSRYVDPGCLPPEEGRRTVPVPASSIRYATIARDLERLTVGLDPSRSIILAHAPPYRTALDRAALDGVRIDGVPADVHVGSIALRRFYEDRQPLLGLHGHVHEAARLSGSWRDRIGRTMLFTAAHDGPELALVRFDTADPSGATRQLVPATSAR